MMKISSTTRILAGIVTLLAHELIASEPIDPAAYQPPLVERFAIQNKGDKLSTAEIPDFQKHISPLLGRLGCNGRACHGSFQGQGGLMLSLFGYDFNSDFEALTAGEYPRVNRLDASASLILTKPVNEQEHGGGQRFEVDSWQYWVLRRWIESGATFSNSKVQKLSQLQVVPDAIHFQRQDQSQPLQVIAHWEDGSREDVTCLCRFQSNDSTIASVDSTGLVLCGDPGDTHIVVSYDSAVIPIQVIRPVAERAAAEYAAIAVRSQIDQLVLDKLKLLGMLPSDVCSDAEFLRRASLDVTGTLPTPAEVLAFLADNDAQKRQKKIDELLERPGYAAQWATFLCDMTGNNEAQLNNFFPTGVAVANQWYQWLFHRVEQNLPYDQIVEGIVTAVSRMPEESYQEYCQSMSEISRDRSGAQYADRPGLVHYWARNNFRSTEDRAVGFAYAFLGVRIQCAQCHKHPFDQWSKSDFDNFEKLFGGITVNQNTVASDGKKLIPEMIKAINISSSLKGNELRKALGEKLVKGDVVPFPELTITGTQRKVKPDKNKKAVPPAAVKAKLLGGDWVELQKGDVRGLLMDWLRRDNPYFAKAIVNRIWAHYFSVGIVHPADDMNLANAPSIAPLLDYLAKGLVSNNYDLKWLHREILNSDTYQRSWQHNESNRTDRRNFSHALLKRLPAEAAYDAIYLALANTQQADRVVKLEKERALSQSGSSRNERNERSPSAYALRVFGRSTRESNCDCDRSNDPSLLQTVFLLNDQDIHRWLADPRTSWTQEVADKFGWSNRSKVDRPNDALIAQLEMLFEKYQEQIASTEAQIAKLTTNDAQANKNKLEKLRDNRDRSLQQLRRFAKQNNLNSELAELLDRDMPLDDDAAGDKDSAMTTEQAQWIIQNAYLRTLSRLPNDSEQSIARQFLMDEQEPVQGIQSLMWSLINTKEFILNH